MSDYYDHINYEFLSLSPSIVVWHQTTSLSIAQPFNSTHLYFHFSQATNLRTLELHYRSEYDTKRYLKEETLIDLFGVFLCAKCSQRLPHLQVTEVSHILINGLPKLKFLTINGEYECGQLYEKQLRDLQKSNTRSFRTEASNTIDKDTLFVWL
ncbi:unnamed protein product [Rotaria sp. Silwood2]|nr:unnamed protein product [Rotaria sp. Silwood2]CAF4492724.1 unnamed protein product [Rotaria sp. Silwood2]CAF4493521.1 unnamed protein product [Rotaria sp. Silwood2]CAF4558146.1 unnamed protein product [Rotaria sp. Silwood2]